MKNFTPYRYMGESGYEESLPTFEQNNQETKSHRTKLLIVDSNIQLANELHDDLMSYNFNPALFHSATTAWKAVCTFSFDLILSDVTLPEGEEAGFELAQKLREAGFRQPILFLTSRNALADRVRAHKYGDDYLGKPFELQELVAKLEAISRRGPIPAREVFWGEIKLFPMERTVYRGRELVRLTPKEYELIELFMLNPGRLFSCDEIYKRVWGEAYVPNSNILPAYLTKIRARLGDKNFIKPAHGSGYYLPR